jgi:hypothetical protein
MAQAQSEIGLQVICIENRRLKFTCAENLKRFVVLVL